MFTNKNGLSPFSIASFLFGPVSKTKANRFIKKIESEGKYYKIILKDFPKTPLFFPKQIDLKNLYQVMAETFCLNDWHQYLVPKTNINKNDIVVDCGAAEGLFSLIAMGKCKKVYAIEPLPIFVKAMRKTFKDIKNVEILPLAVGKSPSRSFLTNSGINSSITAFGKNPIFVETIDNLFYKRKIKIDFIKADLEGFEIDMLKGARKTISSSNPKIAITTYHRKNHSQEISSFLRSINPNYNILTKGVEERFGNPVMLHAWVK